MSYDLFFTANSGKKIDKKTFAAHFGGRRNYEVNKKQAVYQNEDTGVYLSSTRRRTVQWPLT
jgi:hypothetical protein